MWKFVLALSVAAFLYATGGMAQVDGDVPVGKLGLELGTYLTIEGVPPDNQMKAGNMIVGTVNGRKLDVPVLIQIQNVHALPAGVRCVLRGYESGKMIGVPDQVARQEKIPLSQAKWQFFRFFIATSVVEPKELKIIE